MDYKTDIFIKLYKFIYFMKKEILHYPRLDTVIMVEKTIKKHSGELKKKQLWTKLPKKMMYICMKM